MKQLMALLILGALVATSVAAGDLYRVEVRSAFDAQQLKNSGVELVAALPSGYLVVASKTQAGQLTDAELLLRMIAPDVAIGELALDNRLDKANAAIYPVIYEEAGFRLYRLSADMRAKAIADNRLRPVRGEATSIVVPPAGAPFPQHRGSLAGLDIPLDTLVAKVRQDTLSASVFKLQSFYRRLNGTDSNRVARDWIAATLQSYGYDSVVFDSFTVSGVGVPCENVLAYKIGTLFPNQYVIVGAHRDGVSASPAADDNGSGTAGVLELARVLANVETDMTFVFALFDAEESGLNGSYHYVDEAYARGDSVVYMFNMDMIGHFENSGEANLYHGSITTLTNLCVHMLDSLAGITGFLAGASAGSDHYPFTQRGYDATFLAEYNFSTVYHSAQDSTSYMNFEYMTRMVKGGLATVYTVSQTLAALSLACPDGPPEMLAPEVATPFTITATEIYHGEVVPGSGRLHYSLDGAPWVTTPLTENGLGQYTATLPAAGCFARREYYVSIDEATNGSFTLPDPGHPWQAFVATSGSYAFQDQFEVAGSWVVTGDAADGQWIRGVPVGGGDRGDPATSFGGSGACYLTDNVDGNSDVDGGTTILTSPVFAVSASDARVNYARWYNNVFGAAPNADVFRVKLSPNNGLTWYPVDSAGPINDASGGWIENSVWVSDFFTPTQFMKIRFEASDLADASGVEAAVDAVTVSTYECLPPYTCGDCNDDAIGPDIGDLTFMVDYLFFAGAAPNHPEAANMDGIGSVDISDLTVLVDFLFFGSATPTC